MNNNIIVIVVDMSEGESLKTHHKSDGEGQHNTICVPSFPHRRNDDQQQYRYCPLYHLKSGKY